MAGIDEAAAVFDKQLGGVAEVKKSQQASEKPTESMFNHLDGAEDDEQAGGDELPAPGEAEEEEEGQPEQEDEGKPEEEGEGDEEEGEEEDEDVYAVTVDGEEKHVSLKEALEGYIRTETFSKRLSQVMEARQLVAKEAEGLRNERQQVVDKLQELQEQMEAMVPKEPDWDELFKKDPVQARNLQKQYEDFYRQRDAIRAEREKTQKENSEAHNKRLTEYINTEMNKFVNSDKRWQDQKVLTRDLDAMRNTALQHGFSEEEIGAVYDSRMLQVLLKASKYDRLMASKPKPVKVGKKSVQPGAGDSRTARRGLVQAQKRLSKSGSIDDAAAVFQTILRR